MAEETSPRLKLLTARSISAKVLDEMLFDTDNSRGSRIIQPFPSFIIKICNILFSVNLLLLVHYH